MPDRTKALAIAALLPACSASSIPVYIDPAVDDLEHRDRVEEAAATAFGLPVEFVDAPRGALHLELVVVPADQAGGELGGVIEKTRCTRRAWAHRHPIVIAHEMGHLLGLLHAPSGLMRNGNLESWDVADIELDVVIAALDRMEGCRG